MYKLAIEGGPGWALSPRPLWVGRASTNDVILHDEAASGQHAAVWTDGHAVWVRDLRSRNGVAVNGQAIRGTTQAREGDLLRIGDTELRIEAGPTPPPPGGQLVVEHLGTQHSTAFAGDRLRMGDAPGVDVSLPGVGESVLLRVGLNEVLLGHGDDMRSIAIGEPFTLGAHELVVLPARHDMRATVDRPAAPQSYTLEATLEAGPGPRAWVRDDSGAAVLEVVAENRATLLWILGRQLLEDRAGGTPEAREAWVPEATALVSVWGRASGASAANLRVLVCRVRKDLRDAGLDPWILETRSGHLRIRVREVSLH